MSEVFDVAGSGHGARDLVRNASEEFDEEVDKVRVRHFRLHQVPMLLNFLRP
jgi:hypothetical protein